MGVHNPLSEFDSQPTSRFREALSEADDFIRRADGYDEAQVRVDELTEQLRQVRAAVRLRGERLLTADELYWRVKEIVK